jgi:large subunit ribosomal protein L17
MHRHGYKGRKFHREKDQRRALMKGLADSLIIHERIETTLPKAKELRPYVEKLVTKAKVGDLHNRRQIVSSLQTVEAAHKLVDDIAPKLSARNSGYLRIERTTFRRGDNAEMATISFVDDLKEAPVAKAAKVADKSKKSESSYKDTPEKPKTASKTKAPATKKEKK